MPPDPIFTTPRLIVRPWREEDDAAVYAMYGDAEVARYIHGPDATLEDSRRRREGYAARAAAFPAGMGAWPAVARDDGRLVGVAVVQPLAWVGPDIEVGWHLARSGWGNGYATEIGRGCLRHGFTTLGLDTLVAVVHAENTASERVALRIGMRREGTRRVYNIEATFFDLTQAEWTAAEAEQP